MDHLAAKARIATASKHRVSTHVSSEKTVSTSKLTKKQRITRTVESPPGTTTSAHNRRRSVSASPSQGHRPRKPNELKKRDLHRSKESLHTKAGSSRGERDRTQDTEGRRGHHDSRVRSRSPRTTSRARDVKRRLSPLDTKRNSPMRSSTSGARSRNRDRSLDRDRERREKDREEREIARNKEREEALLRCQERQRERERVAREKERRDRGLSREKSLDRDKSSRRAGRDLQHTDVIKGSSRGVYVRRPSPPVADVFQFERDTPEYHSYKRKERSPYEEPPRSATVGAVISQHDKYRSGYEYESARTDIRPGAVGGGYANVWEEEKHKGVPRERIVERIVPGKL